MNRRVDQKEASTVKMQIRTTEVEREQWHELAAKRVTDVSTLIRRLMAREYALEFPERQSPSKRPPKQPTR